MQNPTHLPQWQNLKQLKTAIANTNLAHLFNDNPNRFQQFSITVGDLFVDYSKNFVNQDIMDTLQAMAQAQQLQQAISNLTKGLTFHQAVPIAPYMSLRDPSLPSIVLEGHDITSDIRNTKFQMNRICQEIRSWKWRGFSDKPITDIVTLGVGGAASGAEAVTRALKAYQTSSMTFHFVSNADSEIFTQLLSKLNPDSTLFIVSSKSFSTQETMQNAKLAKQWISGVTASTEAIKQHFLAITAQKNAAIEFGIAPTNILPVWDWLPGRYSLWCSTGLPVALAVGMERYEQFLAGAHHMDSHFQSAPIDENLPVILGLLSIWYVNFWNAPHHAILPYTEALELMPGLVQHSLMEANGKSTDNDGKTVDYCTAPVIWGTAGSSSQHTYFQLLHQGTHIIPADFIIAASQPLSGQNNHSLMQLLAQTEALMQGDSSGHILNSAVSLHEHSLPGNKPSTTILLKTLSPYVLGQLLALYEHIAFVQSVIWNVNPFSHWGTELSKRYSASFAGQDTTNLTDITHDQSTLGLLKQYKNWQTPTAMQANHYQERESEVSYPFF